MDDTTLWKDPVNTYDTDKYFGAAEITPRRSGLPMNIRSIHRKEVTHDKLCLELSVDDLYVELAMDLELCIVNRSRYITFHEYVMIETCRTYIRRNLDLFYKHQLDLTDSFDDKDLFDALEMRGDFK